jgi:hypothetical protein
LDGEGVGDGGSLVGVCVGGKGVLDGVGVGDGGCVVGVCVGVGGRGVLDGAGVGDDGASVGVGARVEALTAVGCVVGAGAVALAPAMGVLSADLQAASPHIKSPATTYSAERH